MKQVPAQTVQVPDGKAEYDAAAAIADVSERLAALRKFLISFPGSSLQNAAGELIVTTLVEIGNASLRAGDLSAASASFLQAAKDAGTPVKEQLFTSTLVKLPANLYFRGEKDAAFSIAKILEGECSANASQLLGIAGFYVSIESGSEAKRLAKMAITLTPDSSSAYQMLGLADRIDFQLEESSAAYSKALELEPDSIAARRGLAEMKRALGKPDESLELYRQILAKDAINLPARTGLILSLFEAGKRDEAEAEMANALAENPGNIMLMAGAAYWYAAHDEGQKAVESAQKAIAVDPRFIWSHIALARGYMVQQMPIEAERTLLAARRYGNFPTLEYEIASARAMAGFYREAAEELSKSFTVKDGVISTKLGGRVLTDSTDFRELVSLERRASIAASASADTPENARQMRSLLDLWTRINSNASSAETLGKAADDFVTGEDKMKTHRQLFAAKELLDRKKDLPKVLELTRAAVTNAESAVDVPAAAAAVMADELYDSRRLAAAKDEYLTVPNVPRATLLAILRGRIEDIAGWALFQSENKAESIVHLRRAVSVLPVGSAWWRASTWRLGTALESDGQSLDALNAYVKSYESGEPDAIKYLIISSLFKRVNGNTFGLETKIGPDPAAPATETVSQKIVAPAVPMASPGPVIAAPERTLDTTPVVPNVEPTPVTSQSPSMEIEKIEPTLMPSPTPEKAEPTTEPSPVTITDAPTPQPTREPTPVAVKEHPTTQTTPLTTKGEPTPASSPTATKVDLIPEPAPATVKVESTPEPTPAVAKVEPTPEPTPVTVKIEPTPEPPPAAAKVEPTPETTSATVKIEPNPEPTPIATKVEPTPEPTPIPVKTEPVPDPSREPAASIPTSEKTISDTKAEPSSSPAKNNENIAALTEPSARITDEKSAGASKTGLDMSASSKVLFPPVIITVPAADPGNKTQKDREPKTETAPLQPEKTQSSETKPPEEGTNERTTTAAAKLAAGRPRIVPVESLPSLPPCTLTISEESLTLENNGGELAVIVGSEDGSEISDLTASPDSPKDVNVKLVPIAGITSRALFVVRSVSTKPGIYQVTFAMPCGKKELLVKVR